jgi:predicted RNA-binding Zn-ribbon protein involved in translation (DUF1610 family)
LPTADEIVRAAAGCAACGHPTVRVRALAQVTLELLDGEPAGAARLDREGDFAERVYAVECAGCGAKTLERDTCPLCGARGGLAAALGGSHGLTVAGGTLPRRCPRCGGDEIAASGSARAHALYVHGAVSRRVVDAEPHEPGFHLAEARCTSCEQVIAQAPGHRCAACGKSSLVRGR